MGEKRGSGKERKWSGQTWHGFEIQRNADELATKDTIMKEVRMNCNMYVFTSLTNIIPQPAVAKSMRWLHAERRDHHTHIYTFSFPPSLPPYPYQLTSSTHMYGLTLTTNISKYYNSYGANSLLLLHSLTFSPLPPLHSLSITARPLLIANMTVFGDHGRLTARRAQWGNVAAWDRMGHGL